MPTPKTSAAVFYAGGSSDGVDGAHRATPEARAADRALGPRDREILKDIIHTFVSLGEPVSSRTVSKHVHHGLSAASIRNVMADLEEMGYLRQPHTSAGRVPTEAAYRLYVEALMTAENLSPRERRYIDEQLRDASGDGEQVMMAASHLLSELSNQAGVVLTPALADVVIKAICFAPLGGRKILCVLVSENGFIDNIVIEWSEELSHEDLGRISAYANANVVGMRLNEVRGRLLHLLAEEQRGLDHWLRQALALTHQAVKAKASHHNVLVEGTNSLLGQPELADLERVRRMLGVFADKTRLVHILSQCLDSQGGVRVVLGHESEVTQELDFSLVATSYGNGHETLGALGVMGPSRMLYPRVVPLVSYLGEKVSQSLATASTTDTGADKAVHVQVSSERQNTERQNERQKDKRPPRRKRPESRLGS